MMYGFGVVGDIGGGFIDLFVKVWIPLFQNHKGMIFTQLVIGLAFTGIYFIVFRYLILKFDIATTGRELKKITKKNRRKLQKQKLKMYMRIKLLFI